MVTKRQVEIVQETWAMVTPIATVAASMFYKRLFELDPGLRFLFHGDMAEQGGKLISMIDAAVKGLSNLDTIVPAVEALGRRHAGYGVTAGHYTTVASALLWTLDQGLGDDFTDEASVAWTEVYMLLAGTMQAGAAAESREARPVDAKRHRAPIVAIRDVGPEATSWGAEAESFLLSQVGLAS